MFKYTKKIVIAASVLAFYSGQLYAMNSDGTDDEEGKPKRAGIVATTVTPDPRFQDELHEEIMRFILTEASKGTNPRRLASVCSYWKKVMRENSPVNKMGVPYPDLNPFMQECMKTFWASRFYNGVLLYNPQQAGKEQTLRFSDLDDTFKGTFDLSACGNAVNELVITTDVERFLQVSAENEGRVVILIALRHLVEQAINSTEAHPLAAAMGSWNAEEAPVGIFWRWSPHENLTWFDYLSRSSLSAISSTDLFENWKKSVVGCGWGWRDEVVAAVSPRRRFHVRL